MWTDAMEIAVRGKLLRLRGGRGSPDFRGSSWFVATAMD